MEHGREDLLRQVTELLATFSRRIELLSNQNENSINILAESIFSRILNLLFECNLKNANYAKLSNNPAIDLIDPDKRIAFQVSATSTNKKIYDTLATFHKNKLYKSYDTLYFFFTTKKAKLQINEKVVEIAHQLSEEVGFEFNYAEHIVFFDDIYKLLKEKNDMDLEKEVLVILEEELASLSRLSNRVNISEDPVHISFSDDMLDFGSKLVEGLLQRKFTIYHDNFQLKNLPQFSNFHDRLFYMSGASQSVKKCIVLFSKDYFREKWAVTRIGNRTLSAAIDSNAQILSYSTSDFTNTVPAHITIGLTYEIKKIKNNNYQEILEDINRKLSIRDELDENPKIFKKFTQIIKSAYPNHNVTLLKQHDVFGFDIYECNDPRFNRSSYFICFHHNAKIEKSYDYISKTHRSILSNSNFLLIIPRDKSTKQSQKRLESFKSVFTSQNTKFLEDFLLECTPKNFKSNYTPFNIQDYIEPSLQDLTNVSLEFNWFYRWFHRTNKPIAVIRGLGGVGKTTLVQKLSDEFVYQKPDSTVIYIDSKDILDELQEIHDNKHIFDLYVFYEATIAKLSKKGMDPNSGIDNELFRLVIDSGNLLMIIDGLDEVIANIPQFDVKSFLKSIYHYCEDFGKSKVLITCRDYFWKKSINDDENPFSEDEIDLNLSTILLQPFDEHQAQLFFEKKHPSNKRRVIKSIQLAKTFIDGNNGDEANKFIPFVLRIVDTMLDTNEAIDTEQDTNFASRYLSQTNKNDTITYNICVREKDRIGQIETDDQIKLFMKFAVDNYASSKPRLSLDDFDEFAKTINTFYTKSARDSLKAHPLLMIEDNHDICFRYDFLAEYFKSIYITHLLLNFTNTILIDDKIIIILCNHAKLNNGFIKEIYYRVEQNKQHVEENIFGLIASIDAYSETDITTEQKQRAISGLLAIAITIKNNLTKPESQKNTELLVNYFANSSGVLHNIYISDFNAYDNSMKTTFDFKDKTLVNCCFDNYEYFWDCKFNENTRFKNCTFKNTKHPKSKERVISIRNFEDCPMDEMMKQIIHSDRTSNGDPNWKIETEIKDFFKIFMWGGQLQTMSIKNNLQHQYRNTQFELKWLINYLYESKVLEFPEVANGNHDQIRVSRLFTHEIKTFCQEGLKAKSVQVLLQDLKKASGSQDSSD